MSSKAHREENFNRVVNLLVNGGAKVLRKILEIHSKKTNPSFAGFLTLRQSKISYLTNKNILNAQQLSLLFPPNGLPVDINTFDITLLTMLLRNLCKLTTPELADVDLLRRERNAIYAHIDEVELDTTSFNRHWMDIEGALLRLSQHVDPIFVSEISQTLKELKQGPLHTGTSLSMLHDWYRSEKELKADINALKDHPVTLLKKRTNNFLTTSKGKNLIDTRQYMQAKKVLQDEKSLFLVGDKGEGKTALAIALINELLGTDCDDRCVSLTCASDFKIIDIDSVDCILIDNIFGVTEWDKQKTNDWMSQLEILESYVEGQRCSVIVTTRIDIYYLTETDFNRYKIFANPLHLESARLTTDEKTRILESILKRHRSDNEISCLNLTSCVTKATGKTGFPGMCETFAMKNDYFNRKERFFDNPPAAFMKIQMSSDTKSSNYCYCAKDNVATAKQCAHVV